MVAKNMREQLQTILVQTIYTDNETGDSIQVITDLTEYMPKVTFSVNTGGSNFTAYTLDQAIELLA